MNKETSNIINYYIYLLLLIFTILSIEINVKLRIETLPESIKPVFIYMLAFISSIVFLIGAIWEYPGY